MFVPNVRGKVCRKLPKRDLFGKEAFAPPVMIPVGIVNIAQIVEATTVRADSSASRGAAQEMVAQAKILVLPTASIGVGDLFIFYGFTIEITSKQPRFNTRGQLDHFELMGKIREEA